MPDMNLPVWFEGQNINEALFCEEFLQERRIIFANRAFFTPNGRVTDDIVLRGEVYEKLKSYTISSVPQKIKNIMELLKLEAMVEDLPPQPDRLHVANGTLMLDGRFIEGKQEIVQSRLPVSYNPDASAPALWLNFLDGLLYPEDIPTLQEFIGYCLIPSNKGQRMMVIKGNGGEGKSQIGSVLSAIFGTNMKDGSIGKISKDRFARADLEHILLCVDDDMCMEALRQTNYVKSIVTAQGRMDLERKNKQSYQGWMFCRLLAFSNGDLQALYDRSDGFYRRQLVLTTKEKPVGRADDPDLAVKPKPRGFSFGRLKAYSGSLPTTLSLRRVTASVQTGKRSSVTITTFLTSWIPRGISGAKRMLPSVPRTSTLSIACGARKTPLPL